MRVRKYLEFVLVALVAILICAYGVLRPYHNWDIIGYVAAAYHADGYRGQDLSARVFGVIESDVEPKLFRELTSGPYRNTVFQDPASLEQQVPFYSIRVIYVGLIRVAGLMGLDYAKASYCISALSAAGCVVLLWQIALFYGVSGFFLPLLVVPFLLADLPVFSTPDALMCAYALGCVLYGLKGGRFMWILLGFIPLFRTDYIVLTLFVSAYLYFTGRRFQALAGLLLSAVCYVLVSHVFQSYGWLTLFNFSFLNRDPYPAVMVVAEDPGVYLIPYKTMLLRLFSQAEFAVYVVAVVFLAMQRRKVCEPLFFYALVLPILFVVVHLALFPMYQSRFFAFAISLIELWIIFWLQGKVNFNARSRVVDAGVPR